MGDGFVTGLNRNVPVPVRGVSGVNQLAGGGLHVCGSLGTQTVECWGDNGYSAPGTVGSQPPRRDKVAVADLALASIDLGAFTFTPGQPVTLAAVVTNVGTATAVGSVLGVRFRVDGTTVAWNENDTSPLAPGESVVLTMTGGVSGRTWTATAGTHAIEATADDANRYAEGNEGDNALTIPLTIPAG